MMKKLNLLLLFAVFVVAANCFAQNIEYHISGLAPANMKTTNFSMQYDSRLKDSVDVVDDPFAS